MRMSIRRPDSLDRRGTVLVVVLVIVALVSLAAFHFTMAMESEHRATRNGGDHIQAEQAALSGIEVLATLLEQPRANRGSFVQFEGVETRMWESRSGAIEDCWFTLELNDFTESAKLNLSSLLEWDRRRPGTAIRGLMQLPGMDERTANRILDWIDADSTQRTPGGEVNARNSLPLFIEELVLLADENKVNPQRPAAEPAWLRFLTVTSAQRNETFEGEARVNLNQGDLRALHDRLRETVSIEFADFVIRFRQYGNESLSEAGESTSDPLPIDFLVLPSRNFASLGELIGSSVAVPSSSDDDSAIVMSPLSLNVDSDAPVGQVLDLLTVRSDKRLSGRVDLSQAPVEVIAAIPGLDIQTAQQIVRVRGLSGQNRLGDQRYRHPIGILSSAGLSPSIVSQVLDKVTVGGDVVKARVTGRCDGDVPEYRCEALLDASHGNPRQLWVKRIGTSNVRSGGGSNQDIINTRN